VKILLIRLRLIGDVVFTTPAIRALRRTCPDAHLDYLVERGAAPVVAHNPHLDHVIVVEHRRGLQRLADDARLATRLRRARYDAVVDFHGGPRASWLALVTGAPVRVGYRVAGRAWMYTRVVDRPAELRARHSVENQWDLLAALDPALDAPPDRARDAVEIGEDRDAVARVTKWLQSPSMGRDPEVVVVHVSAGNPFRRWPEHAFVELVAALACGSANRRIILTAGPSDADAARRIAGAARARLGEGGAPAVVDFPDLDLAELRAVVARAALFVGGDSGPLHVASATATPIVGVFGPTLPERSAPWRDPALVTEPVEPDPLPCRPCDQRVCAPGDFRCLSALPPARVVAAAERALARERTRRRDRAEPV
jgi:lipopolysaccharide heptosyltransferase II